MRSVVTPEDMLKGDLIGEAGWMIGTCTEYKEMDASTDSSTNSIWSFTIDEPSKEKGKSAGFLLNEKGLGMGKSLYAVMNVPKNTAGGYDVSTELFQSFVGKKAKIYVKRTTPPGKSREFNTVLDFQPIGK